MNNEFEPQKYLTVKREDVEAALSGHDKMVLNKLLVKIGDYRDNEDKEPFKTYICVSSTDMNYTVVKNATVAQERLTQPKFHRAVAGRVVTIDAEKKALAAKVADLERLNSNIIRSCEDWQKGNDATQETHRVTVRDLENQVDHWKSNHDQMASRNAELRARPDLKALEMDKLNATINKLTAQVEAVYTAGMEGIGLVGQANYQERCDKAEEDLNIAMYGEE